MINLSFALQPGSPPSAPLNDAIADAVSRGIAVVAGAGNNGSADPAANALAATNPQTIRVASIGAESHRLDAGSNRGSWVDVAASAELSAQSSRSAFHGNGGTSAAAAAVSAISGLLLSCNPALTPAQIKDILMRTSTPYGVDVVARGEVDAYRAVISSGCREPVATVQAVERVKLTVVDQRRRGTVSRQPAAGRLRARNDRHAASEAAIRLALRSVAGTVRRQAPDLPAHGQTADHGRRGVRPVAATCGRSACRTPRRARARRPATGRSNGR